MAEQTDNRDGILRHLTNTDAIPASVKENHWYLADDNVTFSFLDKDTIETLRLYQRELDIIEKQGLEGHDYNLEVAKGDIKVAMAYLAKLNRAKYEKSDVNERIAEISSNTKETTIQTPPNQGTGFIQQLKSLVSGGG